MKSDPLLKAPPHEDKMAGKGQFPMVIGRILFNMGAKLP
jgi:hypothetical protein